MQVIATLMSIVLAGAFLSAWAHYAPRSRGLTVALYAVFGLVALILLVYGAVSFATGRGSHTGALTAIAMGLGIGLPLLRPVRLALARVTPMDADSIPDMVGLSILLAVAIYFAAISLTSGANLEVPSVSPAELIGQTLAEVLIAYLGVGLLITQDLSGATRRLGLRWPTSREVWIALGLVLAAFAITAAASALTLLLQPELEREIEKRLGEMTQHVSSARGALILGISAGVGEELLFRGAIQPRYGIILTSIVFAALHIQYGVSVTILGIFFVSVLFGWERRRYGTSASMITHVVYDVIAVLLGTA